MRRIEISLDTGKISDSLYATLLVAFRKEIEKRGLDPSDYFYSYLVITGRATKLKDKEDKS